jgi:YD repeat-containing protein
MPLPFTVAWRSERERQRRAAAVVAVLRREPEPTDVTWLADAAANGDEDHARWELRYARAALGLLIAQRDAMDDRTAAEIAAAVSSAMQTDTRIAEDRRDLAERQFNERLLGYREALQVRGGPITPADAAGRCLLAFASDGARTAGAPLAYAIELLARFADEAGEALRTAYGTAELPEDVPPSVLRSGS